MTHLKPFFRWQRLIKGWYTIFNMWTRLGVVTVPSIRILSGGRRWRGKRGRACGRGWWWRRRGGGGGREQSSIMALTLVKLTRTILKEKQLWMNSLEVYFSACLVLLSCWSFSLLLLLHPAVLFMHRAVAVPNVCPGKITWKDSMELLAIPGGVSANFALEVTEIHSTLKRDFEGNLDTVIKYKMMTTE